MIYFHVFQASWKKIQRKIKFYGLRRVTTVTNLYTHKFIITVLIVSPDFLLYLFFIQ